MRVGKLNSSCVNESYYVISSTQPGNNGKSLSENLTMVVIKCNMGVNSEVIFIIRNVMNRIHFWLN